jgi:hypothetical protein
MKKLFILLALFVSFGFTSNAQSIDKISAPCPPSAQQAFGSVAVDGGKTGTGDVVISQCQGKTVFIGSALGKAHSNSITFDATNINFGSTVDPQYFFSRTVTTAGTTGNQTINKSVGTVNFAAGATAITVSDLFVESTSIIFGVIRTADTTCTGIKSIVAGTTSFVITLNAACTAETSVGFFVTN